MSSLVDSQAASKVGGGLRRLQAGLLLSLTLMTSGFAGSALCQTRPALSASTPSDKTKVADLPDRRDEAKLPDADSQETRHADTEEQQRARLLADTHRLVLLSRQLQTEILNNSQDTLSLALIKRVEEVQKLAATVKSEMEKTP